MKPSLGAPLAGEAQRLDVRRKMTGGGQKLHLLMMTATPIPRMPVAEKKAVMSLFAEGVMAVLVSTTVIEVGVDVPNASLITDTGLLAWAREVAPLMLDRYPDLAGRHVLRWLGGRLSF